MTTVFGLGDGDELLYSDELDEDGGEEDDEEAHETVDEGDLSSLSSAVYSMMVSPLIVVVIVL